MLKGFGEKLRGKWSRNSCNQLKLLKYDRIIMSKAINGWNLARIKGPIGEHYWKNVQKEIKKKDIMKVLKLEIWSFAVHNVNK
jgi:hypothetical protein